MQEQDNKTNTQKILEAITSLKSDVTSLKENEASILETVNFIKDNAVTHDDLDGLETRLSDRIDSLTTRMVTKEYLDDKLADVRGDFGSLVRKEDAKLRAVVGALEQEKLISKDKVSKISAMEPFPQLAL